MLNHKLGSAVYEGGRGPKMIAHICNNAGVWGAGFVVPLGEKYPEAKRSYQSLRMFPLGYVDLVKVADDVWVANIIGQTMTPSSPGASLFQITPVLFALDGLWRVCAARGIPEVVMPRIGCGIGGATWESVHEMLICSLMDCHGGFDPVPEPLVTVYTLPSEVGSFPQVEYA